MIQNSMNQLLGIAGMVGGYAGKLREGAIKSKIDLDAQSAANAAEEAAGEYQKGNVEQSLNMQDAQVAVQDKIEKRTKGLSRFTNPVGVNSYAQKKLAELNQKDYELWRDIGMQSASNKVQLFEQQANENNMTKKAITPGDIRRELEAKEAKEKEEAKQKGIAERNLEI